MRKWRCVICNHIYDEAEGDADSGIAPGTKMEDVPDDWCCPDCGAEKADFELIIGPRISRRTAGCRPRRRQLAKAGCGRHSRTSAV